MDKTESDLLNVRFEFRLSDPLSEALDMLSRRAGLTPSSLLRSMIARDARATFGDRWDQEHPKGDHGSKDLVKPVISGGDHEK